MGNSSIKQPLDNGTGPPGFFVLSLNGYHHSAMRLAYAPPSVVEAVRGALAEGWWHARPAHASRHQRKRAVTEANYGGAHEFRLGAHPWRAIDGGWGPRKSSTDARRAVMRVLAALHAQGWKLEVSTDFSRKPHDLSALVFSTHGGTDARAQAAARAQANTPCEFACVCFPQTDRIRVFYEVAEGSRGSKGAALFAQSVEETRNRLEETLRGECRRCPLVLVFVF